VYTCRALMKKKIIITLLAAHLLLLYAGTRFFDFGKIPTALQSPIIIYLSIVGGHNYAFFSPDIPTQILVRCKMTYMDGHTEYLNFDSVANTYQLRSNYLYQILDNEEGYETTAKIAANYCFKQHANARTVKVSVSRYIVPSIQDYKAGKGSRIDELFSYNFTHE
jgi:hypothetical protein